jgi:Fe2+ or Zn2+ uptake regulation protein
MPTLSCARAIVDVLREAGRPLTVLDLLDELGRHYRGWTSAAVRHTLADLVEQGVVTADHDARPCSYALAAGRTTAPPGPVG